MSRIYVVNPSIPPVIVSLLQQLTDACVPPEDLTNEEWVVDTTAVLGIACRMLTKMRSSSDKGRGGWYNPTRCSLESLMGQFFSHIPKGDLIDVMNFAMMLEHRRPELADAEFLGQFQVMAKGEAANQAGVVLEEMDASYREAKDHLREQFRGNLNLSESPTLKELYQAERQVGVHLQNMLLQIKAAMPDDFRLDVDFITSATTDPVSGGNSTDEVSLNFKIHHLRRSKI